jgi:dimethylglycine dehydrogenase
VDSSYYLRQENYGFNLGPYERNCKAHWVDARRSDAGGFQLPALSRRSGAAGMVHRRRHGAGAAAGRAGLSKNINGPIPYAPDGLPLIGPMPGVPNAFEACVFTFGIARAAGAGKVLAEWITEGQTEWDMWSVRSAPLHRLHRPRLLRRQGHGGLWPRIRHALPASRMARGRDKKLSPVHDR